MFTLIIITHWIADFVFQAEEWAIGKSKALAPLLKHTLTYSAIWMIPTLLMYGNIQQSLLFCGITFIVHTITDFFTSKIVAKKFAKGHYGSAIPNFGAFTIIGIDQVLHYLQLYWTWELIFK